MVVVMQGYYYILNSKTIKKNWKKKKNHPSVVNGLSFQN